MGNSQDAPVHPSGPDETMSSEKNRSVKHTTKEAPTPQDKGYKGNLVPVKSKQNKLIDTSLMDDIPVFPKDGVYLDAFAVLIERCGGREAIGTSTSTLDVCEKFIKPLSGSGSFINFLSSSAETKHLVGSPNLYISYSSSESFIDLVDAIMEACKYQRQSTVIWLDVFSCDNSDIHRSPSFEYLCGSLNGTIQDIGRVLLIVSPWPNPSALSQSTCLWDIILTGLNETKFSVGMTKANFESFEADVVGNFPAIEKLISEIDITNGVCAYTDDNYAIQFAVESSLGIINCNSLLVRKLQAWLREASGVAEDNIRFRQARKFHIENDFEMAERKYYDVLCFRKKHYGDLHIKTITTIRYQADVLFDQDRFDEAEPQYKYVLDLFRKEHGTEHPDYQEVLRRLAIVYEELGESDRAEPLRMQRLQDMRRSLGDSNQETIKEMERMATLLQDQGKLDQAEPFLRILYETKKNSLGPFHPETSEMLESLTNALNELGKIEEAEPLFLESLKIQKNSLGATHRDTLKNVHQYSSLLRDNGRFAGAEQVQLEALASVKEVFGPTHEETLHILNGLRELYMEQERYGDARPLCQEALDIQRVKFEAFHPDIMLSILKMAKIETALGNLEAAEALFREALMGHKHSKNGLLNDRALSDMKHLALTLQAENKFNEAEYFFHELFLYSEKQYGRNHTFTIEALNTLNSHIELKKEYFNRGVGS